MMKIVREFIRKNTTIEISEGNGEPTMVLMMFGEVIFMFQWSIIAKRWVEKFDTKS